MANLTFVDICGNLLIASNLITNGLFELAGCSIRNSLEALNFRSRTFPKFRLSIGISIHWQTWIRQRTFRNHFRQPITINPLNGYLICPETIEIAFVMNHFIGPFQVAVRPGLEESRRIPHSIDQIPLEP